MVCQIPAIDATAIVGRKFLTILRIIILIYRFFLLGSPNINIHTRKSSREYTWWVAHNTVYDSSWLLGPLCMMNSWHLRSKRDDHLLIMAWSHLYNNHMTTMKERLHSTSLLSIELLYLICKHADIIALRCKPLLLRKQELCSAVRWWSLVYRLVWLLEVDSWDGYMAELKEGLQ